MSDPMDLPTNNPYRQPQQQPFNMDRPSHETQPNGSRRSDFVLRLMLMLVMLFLILIFITVIAWLVINPHDPAFRLNSLNISKITLTNSQFTATYDIKFTVNNPNKKVNLLIDHVKLDVVYKKNVISERILDVNVSVTKMSQEILNAELGRDSVHSVKHGVFKYLSDDWSKKMVTLNVDMCIRIRFALGNWPTKQRFLAVSCMNLPVEFVSIKGTGKLMSEGKDCPVRLVDSI